MAVTSHLLFMNGQSPLIFSRGAEACAGEVAEGKKEERLMGKQTLLTCSFEF